MRPLCPFILDGLPLMWLFRLFSSINQRSGCMLHDGAALAKRRFIVPVQAPSLPLRLLTGMEPIQWKLCGSLQGLQIQKWPSCCAQTA